MNLKSQKPISAIHREFCRLIVTGVVKSKAAQDVGLKKSSANNILKRPEVAEYIEAMERQAYECAGITSEWILAKTKQTLLAAESESDYKNVFRGLEMLGKNKKLWSDNTSLGITLNQMGKITVGSGTDEVAITFDVGQKPNELKQIN